MTHDTTPENAADATTEVTAAGGDTAPAPARRRRASRSAAAPAAVESPAVTAEPSPVAQQPTSAEQPVPAEPESQEAPAAEPAPRARRSRRVTRTVVVEPQAAPAPVGETATDETAADETATDETAADEQTVDEQTVDEQPVIEPTATEGVVTEDAVTEDAVAEAVAADEPVAPARAPRRRRASTRAAAPAVAEAQPETDALQVDAAQDETPASVLDVRAALAATLPAVAVEPAATTTRTTSGGGAPRLATTALLFQAPDPAAARPRRRRAQASAGSPEAISQEAHRSEQDDSQAVVVPADGLEPGQDTPAGLEQLRDEADRPAGASRSSRRRGRRGRGGDAAREAAPAADDDAVDEGVVVGDDQDGQVDDSQVDDGQVDEADVEDEAEDGPDGQTTGAPRRRRRRGGRGRRPRPDQPADGSGEAEPQDEGDEPDDDTQDEVEDPEQGAGEVGGSSRRRRRRRRGSRPDAPEGERTRSTRPVSDEPTALRGSTRLEAKRQRRREGRDAGRRRQIISEAEFLARRESVERSMVVREKDGRMQIAVLEDGVLVEHYVSNQAQASMVGNVYLGRVQNVLPSMEAAFVDVGKGRNAVLYAGEVNWDAAGLEGGQPRRIEQALKSGDSVLVQVTKDPIGHKGARLTSQVTLAGRYLVYVPGGGMTGISRKLPDVERNRLKKILREVVPESAGVIVRTAAEGASEDELRADIARLQGQWEAIEKKSKTASSPALLQGEPDMAIRVVRDIFNDDFSSLVVQGRDAWSTISSYIDELAPDLAQKVTQWTSQTDVFSVHRIDEQLAKGMDRKVWLPSGGSLVIDRTEAMTVVDVNTGKFTGSGGTLEETVTRNNLEAAEEIVRQLRLRDIGGIIVIDFIDMVLESNRDLVLRRLVECLGRDRTKHQVAEVTSLGLVQMTRKRVGQGLVEAFSETCEHCHGRGFIVHEEPVEKNTRPDAGAPQQPVGDGEPKQRSRRKRTGTKEPVASTPHAGVPVLPEAREAVKATLATIAAAAAHAHEVEHAHASVVVAEPVEVVGEPVEETALVGAGTEEQAEVPQVEVVAAEATPVPEQHRSLDVLAEFAATWPAAGQGVDATLELTPVAPDVFEAVVFDAGAQDDVPGTEVPGTEVPGSDEQPQD